MADYNPFYPPSYQPYVGDSVAIWRILDDHMSSLQVVNERVYNSIMRRINAL